MTKHPPVPSLELAVSATLDDPAPVRQFHGPRDIPVELSKFDLQALFNSSRVTDSPYRSVAVVSAKLAPAVKSTKSRLVAI